jgi:hypothetical protein
MLENTAVASAFVVDLKLAEGCQKILNTQDLSHQFNKLNLTDVCLDP